MRNLLGGLGLAAALLWTFMPAPVGAQTASSPRKISSAAHYDVRDEKTLTGTVTSVISHRQPGMLLGAHLLLSTSSGKVDAYLGPFAFIGADPVAVSAGQTVRVVGVTMNLRGSPVFLTRTVSVGPRTYTIRNDNGFPRFPSGDAHADAPAKGAQ
jgi:hypothetical protein